MKPNPKSGKTAPRGRGSAKRAHGNGRGPVADAAPHPGPILAEVLDDTPDVVAARWFGMTPENLRRLLAGEIPMTVEMATVAGTVFGTGAAPWLDMVKNWEVAQVAKVQKTDGDA